MSQRKQIIRILKVKKKRKLEMSLEKNKVNK